MNIRSMYSDIDLDANGMETEFQAAFEDLLFFINAHLANTGVGNFDGEDVTVIFNRDILINETEAIDNCGKSKGIISDETIVKQHPWVDDPEEELARLKAEKEAAAPVIEALKSAGWEFACNGYDGTNYGSDEEAVSADLTKWNESVGTLVGNTAILLFPSGTDSRGWKAYDESDPVYQILKKQGFLYYGSMDISGTKTQLTEQYLRCSYMNVDGYRMYQDLYKDAGRFTGILDFQEIYDSKRPMAVNETDTQATGGEDEKASQSPVTDIATLFSAI